MPRAVNRPWHAARSGLLYTRLFRNVCCSSHEGMPLQRHELVSIKKQLSICRRTQSKALSPQESCASPPGGGHYVPQLNSSSHATRTSLSGQMLTRVGSGLGPYNALCTMEQIVKAPHSGSLSLATNQQLAFISAGPSPTFGRINPFSPGIPAGAPPPDMLSCRSKGQPSIGSSAAGGVCSAPIPAAQATCLGLGGPWCRCVLCKRGVPLARLRQPEYSALPGGQTTTGAGSWGTVPSGAPVAPTFGPRRAP